MFLLVSWRLITKIAGIAEPDPHQNVMDPQHCFLLVFPLNWMASIFVCGYSVGRRGEVKDVGPWSAVPCLWLMDPDSEPDPAVFVIDIQDASKKLIYLKKFFLLISFWKYGTFSKIKVEKKSQNSRNQGFSYYFCLMIEGSGPG
jgi:hypothetical protein